MILHRAYIRGWLLWDASSFFEWLAVESWYVDILNDWVAVIPINPRDQCLEVGCGPGLLTGALYGRGVAMIGLDRSPAMVDRARKNVPGCVFIEGNALAIPMEADAVDAGFDASVVNVVADPQTVVRELARVVRPGGRVIGVVSNPMLNHGRAGHFQATKAWGPLRSRPRNLGWKGAQMRARRGGNAIRAGRSNGFADGLVF